MSEHKRNSNEEKLSKVENSKDLDSHIEDENGQMVCCKTETFLSNLFQAKEQTVLQSFEGERRILQTVEHSLALQTIPGKNFTENHIILSDDQSNFSTKPMLTTEAKLVSNEVRPSVCVSNHTTSVEEGVNQAWNPILGKQESSLLIFESEDEKISVVNVSLGSMDYQVDVEESKVPTHVEASGCVSNNTFSVEESVCQPNNSRISPSEEDEIPILCSSDDFGSFPFNLEEMKKDSFFYPPSINDEPHLVPGNPILDSNPAQVAQEEYGGKKLEGAELRDELVQGCVDFEEHRVTDKDTAMETKKAKPISPQESDSFASTLDFFAYYSSSPINLPKTDLCSSLVPETQEKVNQAHCNRTETNKWCKPLRKSIGGKVKPNPTKAFSAKPKGGKDAPKRGLYTVENRQPQEMALQTQVSTAIGPTADQIVKPSSDLNDKSASLGHNFYKVTAVRNRTGYRANSVDFFKSSGEEVVTDSVIEHSQRNSDHFNSFKDHNSNNVFALDKSLEHPTFAHEHIMAPSNMNVQQAKVGIQGGVNLEPTTKFTPCYPPSEDYADDFGDKLLVQALSKPEQNSTKNLERNSNAPITSDGVTQEKLSLEESEQKGR